MRPASLAHCEQLDGTRWLAGQFRPRRGRHHRGEPDGLGRSPIPRSTSCWRHWPGKPGAPAAPSAEAAISWLTARIAPAQDEDGYLGTAFGHPGQPARYSDLEMGHELYNIGHLLQAAVARLRTVGDDELVRIARRAADHVCAAFGPDGRQTDLRSPGDRSGSRPNSAAPPGDEPGIIEQSRLFLERRGRATLWPMSLSAERYFQDDMPIRDADVWRGHAVRALYLVCCRRRRGGRSAGRCQLLAAVRAAVGSIGRPAHLLRPAVWVPGTRTRVRRRLGATPGPGLLRDLRRRRVHHGVLAAVPGHRRSSGTQDLIERTLFNVIADLPAAMTARRSSTPTRCTSGWPPSHTDHDPGQPTGRRRHPRSLVRCVLLPHERRPHPGQHLTRYLATTDNDGLQVHLYATSTHPTPPCPMGGPSRSTIETDYPRPAERSGSGSTGSDPRPWTLTLRVPSWASGAVLSVDGRHHRTHNPARCRSPGSFGPGDEVILTLPTAAAFHHSRP